MPTVAPINISVSSGLNDSLYGKCLAPIKECIFNGGISEADNDVFKLFRMTTSDKYADYYTSVTGMGRFKPVPEGGASPNNTQQEGYGKLIKNNKEWRSSFDITEQMVEDEQITDMAQRSRDFRLAYDRTRVAFAIAMLTGATDTSVNFEGDTFDTTCNDGLALFSTAHTSKTGGTANQSNYFGNTLTYDNLALVQTAMQNFKDDDGNYVHIRPDTLVIPNNALMKKTAQEIVASYNDPTNANNATNTLRGIFNVIVLPEWNTSTGWMLVDTQYNNTVGCATWTDRVPLKVTMTEQPEIASMRVFGRSRFNAGFINWRGFAMCSGNTDGSHGTVLE